MNFPFIGPSNSAHSYHIRWDRLPVTHSGPILALDWSNAASSAKDGLGDDNIGTSSAAESTITSGGGSIVVIWVVQSRPVPLPLFYSTHANGCGVVWIWDASLPHIPHKPTYTLYPSFPVRCVRWRAGYEYKVAVVSNDKFGEVSSSDFSDAGGGSGSRGTGMC